MKNVSLKMSEEMDAEVERMAAEMGVGKSTFVRDAVAEYVVSRREPQKGSVLDRVGDLAGCVDGPEDLSFNPEHMDSFGR